MLLLSCFSWVFYHSYMENKTSKQEGWDLNLEFFSLAWEAKYRERVLVASRRLHLRARVSAMVTWLLECHVSTDKDALGTKIKGT